jgi:hypothetical protein
LGNTVKEKQGKIYQNQKNVKITAETEEHNSAKDKKRTERKKIIICRELRQQ